MGFYVALPEESRSGKYTIEKGESERIVVDLQMTNTLGGHFSIQAISDKDVKVEIYHTNWFVQIPNLPTFQLDTEFFVGGNGCLIFKLPDEHSVTLTPGIPVHKTIPLPITRTCIIVVRNMSEDDEPANVFIHPLFV